MMSNSNSSDNSKKSKNEKNEKNEDPFDLINRGNGMKSSSNWWSASDYYGRASVVLRSMASMNAKDRRIGGLYGKESQNYLSEARLCLLKALQLEHDMDVRAKSSGSNGKEEVLEVLEPLLIYLPEDEAQRRRRIFQRLYAPTPISLEETTKEEEKVQEEEQKELVVDDIAEMEEELLVTDPTNDVLNQQHREIQPQDPNAKKSALEQTNDSNHQQHTSTPKDDSTSKNDPLPLPPPPPPFHPNNASNNNKNDNSTANSFTALATNNNNDSKEKDLDRVRESLESRLQDLNAATSNLPTEKQSDERRMKEIDDGLRRLGLNGVMERPKPSSGFWLDDTPKTEEEQVDDIMNRAMDELQLETHSKITTSNATNTNNQQEEGHEDNQILNNQDDLERILTNIKPADKNFIQIAPNHSAASILKFISTAESLLLEATTHMEQSMDALDDDADDDADDDDDDDADDDDVDDDALDGGDDDDNSHTEEEKDNNNEHSDKNEKLTEDEQKKKFTEAINHAADAKLKQKDLGHRNKAKQRLIMAQQSLEKAIQSLS